MAVITLDIPNAKVDRVVAAVAQQTGTNTTGFTAQQKSDLVKVFLKTALINAVQASEVPSVVQTAQTTQLTDIATQITAVIT